MGVGLVIKYYGINHYPLYHYSQHNYYHDLSNTGISTNSGARVFSSLSSQ